MFGREFYTCSSVPRATVAAPLPRRPSCILRPLAHAHNPAAPPTSPPHTVCGCGSVCIREYAQIFCVHLTYVGAPFGAAGFSGPVSPVGISSCAQPEPFQQVSRPLRPWLRRWRMGVRMVSDARQPWHGMVAIRAQFLHSARFESAAYT